MHEYWWILFLAEYNHTPKIVCYIIVILQYQDCCGVLFLNFESSGHKSYWHNSIKADGLILHLYDISFNTVELDFVDLPNYIKIKLLIGDCGFYINEIEGMYLDVIGRNLLKKLYHERNILLAQSNVLWLNSLFLFLLFFIDNTCFIHHVCLYSTIVCILL